MLEGDSILQVENEFAQGELDKARLELMVEKEMFLKEFESSCLNSKWLKECIPMIMPYNYEFNSKFQHLKIDYLKRI